MNLVNDPWIPFATNNTVELLSIKDVLRTSSKGQIRCPTPLEDAAIHRLLFAIAMAALRPASVQDIDTWLQKPADAMDKVCAYLDACKDRFDLLSHDHPFMQVAGLEQDKATSVSVLCLSRATGNTPALFDHSRDDEPRPLTPAAAARALLAHQACAVALGKSPSVIINGETIARGSRKDGTCTRGLLVWLAGPTVAETILMNLLPVEAGMPVWEQDTPYLRADDISHSDPIPFDGLADRYTMMSRLVRLLKADDGLIHWMYYSMGRSEADGEQDPMKILYVDPKTQEKRLQSVPLTGLTWTYLNRILAPGASPILDQARELRNLPANVSLQTAGLRSEFGKAAKMVGWGRDVIPSFSQLLKHEAVCEDSLAALEEANKGAALLPRKTLPGYWAKLTPFYYQHLVSGSFGDTWKDTIARVASSFKDRKKSWEGDDND